MAPIRDDEPAGPRVGGRVVVLGSSLGGLLAARVLAASFDEVLLVDRDKLVGVPGYRRGVPHGRHAHALVARGQLILESQFPGLTDQLAAAGVRPGDFNGDIQWHFNGRRLKPSTSGLISMPATRPVLEYHVRTRVQGISNVRFLENHDIVGLETTPDHRRVTGARVQRQGQGGAPEVLQADLVIDSTGRGSRTPAWLEEMGYPRPDEDRVKVDLAYTTRHYWLPYDPFGSDQVIILAPTPATPRGAIFYRLPGDGGRLELSLIGMLGDHAPTDPDGFLDFARSLPTPGIFEHVRKAEPLDDPVMFRYPASVRKRFERLKSFPENYLVIGDAVCSFNPIYAQGMTMAAAESLILRKHLAAGSNPDPRAFFRDISREIDLPWEVSAGADLAYPGVEGRRTLKSRLANAYVAKLQDAAVHDATLANAFVRVTGLIDPPQSLMRPGYLLRVLRHSGRQQPVTVAPPPPEQQQKAA
jgi:2-polyprenyl-6-methoxyphenol hydroxylase-like FAD-dependent oxidoreductase